MLSAPSDRYDEKQVTITQDGILAFNHAVDACDCPPPVDWQSNMLERLLDRGAFWQVKAHFLAAETGGDHPRKLGLDFDEITSCYTVVVCHGGVM
jgi:hypothetical protein